jgi:uncharacterized OsmC-like protein
VRPFTVLLLLALAGCSTFKTRNEIAEAKSEQAALRAEVAAQRTQDAVIRLEAATRHLEQSLPSE